MNDKIPEELISAYIDGELTSDEQARVEQALLEDPQSQQLLEDLQALHDQLQAIPRSEPSQDYTQQILRRAERAILTGTSETPGTSDGTKTAAVQIANPGARSNQPANLKHLIWATTALAATLVLALLFRQGNQDVYQVTDANNDQKASSTPPASTMPGEESTETLGLEGEEESAQMAGGARAPAAEADTAGSPGKNQAQPANARKRSEAASFGSPPAPANEILSTNQKTVTPRETVIYINISQEDYEQQAVLRTLVEQQLAFNYDPVASAGFRGQATRSLDDAPAAAGLRERDGKKSQLPQDKEAEESGEKKNRDTEVARRSKRDGSYRVITLEATQETLDELVRNLSDHHQVQRAPRPGVNLLTKESLKAPGKKDSDPRLALPLADKPGGQRGQRPEEKLKGKADKNEPSQSADEQLDQAKKEARFLAATVTSQAQQERQDLAPSMLRIVLIVSAHSSPARTVSDQPDTPVKKPKSPK